MAIMICRAPWLVSRFPYRECRQDWIRVGGENDKSGRRNHKQDALQRTAGVRIDQSAAFSVNLISGRKLIGLGAARAAAVLGNAEVAIPVAKEPVNLIGHGR